MKRRLYFAAVNNRYGDNVFLPYAAGLMWAYAKQFPEIANAYEMCGMLYLKEPIAQAVARLDEPDVLALSSYIWNHEWNKAFARAVKERWPGCTILVGGVQVPENSPRILEECEAFDFAIYGEGEGAFADFLREHAKYFAVRDFSTIGSLVYRDIRVSDSIRVFTLVNPRRDETPIDTIPSPYLEGLFDEIIASRPDLRFQALQETNRGCPYACTFCAWGAAALTKVRQFDGIRICHEYKWMSLNKIEMLYNADANYGILRRDVELTDMLVGFKERFGYPRKFRAAFAKNSNDTVFEISKTLADADMLKATTLALQSEDDGVLVNIKRKNIKHDKFAELSKRYEEAGIATYVELIVGLPGETFESFVAGIDRVLEAGQHDSLSIYLCMLLANTEMATSEYRRAHGIESVPMKALLYHGTPEPAIPEEVQETVIATATMPRAALCDAVLYGWMVQAFHSFGLVQHVARELRMQGVPYSSFYLRLIRWLFMSPETVGGRELFRAAQIWADVKRGASWDTVDPRFGDVSWPPEELLFLRCAVESARFYAELLDFLKSQMQVGDYLAEELVSEQRACFIPPQPGHTIEYAREAVWFGRKGQGRKLRLRDG